MAVGRNSGLEAVETCRDWKPLSNTGLKTFKHEPEAEEVPV